jgi:hypothetical protein
MELDGIGWGSWLQRVKEQYAIEQRLGGNAKGDGKELEREKPKVVVRHEPQGLWQRYNLSDRVKDVEMPSKMTIGVRIEA